MRDLLTTPEAQTDDAPDDIAARQTEAHPRPPTTWQIVRQTPRWGWPAYHDVIRTVAALERAPVFFGLPDSRLRALARRVRRVTILPSELIVRQGERGDTLFLIERGHCRVVVEDPPHALTVAVLTEGDLFGEEVCALNVPHEASVYSQGECTLLALDRPSIHSVLGPENALLEELSRVAEQRRSAYRSSALRGVESARLEQGTVVAVHGARGGSGTTSIALNLVGALAQRYPGEVLLLDLDLPYAHSALLAGLVPTTCLARLRGATDDTFDELLLSAVLYHAGGPMILSGALRPEEADEVSPELVARAITALRKSFRYIVVDTSSMFTDPVLATFDLAQSVVVVIGTDLSAVKSAADSIDVLLRLGIPDGALKLVLNNRTARPVLDRAAVERLVKRPIDVEIAFDGVRPALAAMRGEIVSLTQQRSEIARGAQDVASLLERSRRGEDLASGARRR